MDIGANWTRTGMGMNVARSKVGNENRIIQAFASAGNK
jgi:hypothetical protein